MTCHFKAFFVFILVALCASCEHSTMPKPYAYFRIDERKDSFVPFDSEVLTMNVPQSLLAEQERKGTERWFTFRLPAYRATLYCTYLPITSQKLYQVADENHRLAFSHAVKASGIEQHTIANADSTASGILYAISGSVATPRQLYLTDRKKHFFRASLYFDGKVNPDSLAPVLGYIDLTLQQMVQTLRWK